MLPGLALRAAASGTVKKNRELTVTGPYAYTRNPLYLARCSSPPALPWRCSAGPWRWLLAVGFAAHLYSGHRFGGAISARALSRASTTIAEACRASFRASRPLNSTGRAACTLSRLQLPAMRPAASRSPFTSSTASTMLHIGAALLYLSLLFLRPALERSSCIGPVSAFVRR